MLPVVEGRWNGFQPDCSCLRPDYVHIAVEPLAGLQDGRFIGGPPVLVFEAGYIAAAAVLLGGFHGLPEQICRVVGGRHFRPTGLAPDEPCQEVEILNFLRHFLSVHWDLVQMKLYSLSAVCFSPVESGCPVRLNSIRVPAAPLDFSDPDGLRRSMLGAGVLYNTYWIRFGGGGADHL